MRGRVCASCGFNNTHDLPACSSCGGDLSVSAPAPDLVAERARPGASARRRVTLSQEMATVYERPSASSRVRQKLVAGASFLILDRVSAEGREWFWIQTPMGTLGYVEGDAGVREEVPAARHWYQGRKGMVIGLVLMLLAVAWFVTAWLRGFIVVWPAGLFVLGLLSFVSGVTTLRYS